MGDYNKERQQLEDLIYGAPLSKKEAEAAGLKVLDLPIDELHQFKGHPFKVIEESEDFEGLVESITQYGIIEPIVVRKSADGYEIISGHRRTRAAEIAGLDHIQGVVVEADDDTATIMMVDANKKREKFLPSELAYALKMRYDACKHQGVASGGEESSDMIGKDFGMSARNVHYYIGLTRLIPELMDYADDKKLQIKAAIELSSLSADMQQIVLDACEMIGRFPNKAQAKALKEMGTFGLDWVLEQLQAPEKRAVANLVIPEDKIGHFFPEGYSAVEKEALIVELLTKWHQETEGGR